MNTRFASHLGATALVSGLFVGLAAPAVAGPTYENSSGGTFRYYGQFNPSFQSFDDGGDDFSALVDNANSNSRIGFWLEQPFGDDTLRFNFETAFGLRSSDGVDQNGRPQNISWDRTRIRKVDLQYATARYGTFSFGQGSMASDGLAESDLSGTGVIQTSSIADSAGGFLFRTSTGALSGVSIGSAFRSLDGGRLGRVRYDTPELSGFTVSASYGEEILRSNSDREAYDIAVRYTNDDLGDLTINGALGAVWNESGPGSKTRDIVASFAALHEPSGVSFAVAGGDRDTGGDYAFAKLGYTANFLSVGATSFAIDYYDGSDMVTSGDSAESWGVAAVQNFDNLNLETYVAYRDYSYSDTSATSYQDSSSIMAGARWKF
ncbi:Outer membrane protein (porin) [Phaeobacter piscinae]|uniref:Outer membrane protein (Porin) n=1 Tax=Phaeobacter piscinae TaxID=1580596 RepID=A0ABN5DEV7_9RHOB|nr:porin [Phaeobacter piscinae]ATG35865.1 Outer membrane protein (porin) [Phaeobacter piscinae]AUQ86386.1 Outer membrane protein (porin) [Phaeobacter piscinae]AUR24269.1 Outer membrane protein (porin) [Phaeobacter piscinae]